MKQRAPSDFKEQFLDEWTMINSPDELAEKFQEYEDIKKTLKQKSSGTYFKGRQDFKGTEKYRKFESPRKFEHNCTDKNFSKSASYNQQHENQAKNYGNQQRSHRNSNRGYSRNNEREKYSSYNAPKHAETNYSKFRRFKDPERESNTIKPKKTMNSAKVINKSTETCAIIGKESLRTKEIMFGNEKITALIDTRSTVSLLREKTSRRIIDPMKLAKNKILLTGIGEAQVTKIGSFEREFQMDEEYYSLTWHVVPTAKLKFEAIIGSDILEQASVNFTKNGIEFVKYENQALLMQISAENIEEVELNHIRDFKIKKELKKLIENYKPEKTATMDVTMRIILKDNEPVCQSPC
ncbi:hypothetical protein AVEN_89145-1 [Araneus ventricosus]|uniref:Peptidase A2 domain-containing protein n=1 Tax=Araneus ventricosus TaxID=182803 RepID=A0A4Y2B176_ARAVE|nr:hypothetical protein AVEN_89145-1 [Araneus ventricosus]